MNLTGLRANSISDVAKLFEKHIGRKVNVDIVGRKKAEQYHKEKTTVPENNFWVLESWAGWRDDNEMERQQQLIR